MLSSLVWQCHCISWFVLPLSTSASRRSRNRSSSARAWSKDRAALWAACACGVAIRECLWLSAWPWLTTDCLPGCLRLACCQPEGGWASKAKDKPVHKWSIARQHIFNEGHVPGRYNSIKNVKSSTIFSLYEYWYKRYGLPSTVIVWSSYSIFWGGGSIIILL